MLLPACLLPYLAGSRQGCCRRQQRCSWLRGMPWVDRGLSTESLTADDGLGEVLEHPMLRCPHWKRTRQACGFSGWLIPLCPRKRRGGAGREGHFLGLLGLQGSGRRWAGGDGGKRAVGAQGGGAAVPGMPLAFQGDPGKGCERPREAGIRSRGLRRWFWPQRLPN